MKRVTFSLAVLGLLAGCGIPGGLERPDPLWNSDEVIRRECERPLGRGERRDPRCEELQQNGQQRSEHNVDGDMRHTQSYQSARQERTLPDNLLAPSRRDPNASYIHEGANAGETTAPAPRPQ